MNDGDFKKLVVSHKKLPSHSVEARVGANEESGFTSASRVEKGERRGISV
jgi:hypothetical protein